MYAVMAFYAGSNDGVWLPSAASATYTIPTDCTQQSPPPSFQVLLLASWAVPSEQLYRWLPWNRDLDKGGR